MNRSQRRAWQALEIGPQWRLRHHVSSPEPLSSPPPESLHSALQETVRAAAPAAQAARPPSPDVAGLDWAGLQEAVVACRLCPLCETRRNAVFGAGDRRAAWMVVGEAPGTEEDRSGEPFVGRAGQLLDAMLASVGRSRSDGVFIANVLKCRPPENRDPLATEIVRCAPYLRRQIELVSPELILVAGRIAAQALLGTDVPIGGLRGKAHRLRSGEREIPVVVTYHPAYLLRTPLDKARAWADLRLAVSLSASARQ